ncbi:DUF5131 family protein [Bosea eneae]|uniref:DUF5131 family protein n=1 Tax=Bosea eneae TaxID=151454 RepID=A0ABW0J1X9_9HYPH
MAETTGISWADQTWSPWTGCAKVSPACDGCYAAHLMGTRMGRVEWGEPGVGEGTRSLMSDSYWRQPLSWDRAAAKAGTRPFVFPSLCDPFDTAVPAPWRWRFVELMEATPHLVWLLLTKRLGNVSKLTDPARGERPLPENVAFGGTFCNQAEWDRDGSKLRDLAERFHPLFTFGSFEPLLGSIDFRGGWCPDWIVVGGESDQGAHKARPMHHVWVHSLHDQAVSRRAIFHLKQWGEWRHAPDRAHFKEAIREPWRRVESGMAGIRPAFMVKEGRRHTGRLLDGKLFDGRPEVRHA